MTMTKRLTRAGLLAALFAGAVLFAGGCNKAEPVAENKDKGKGPDEEKDDHSGWWCKPHGVPEDECSMCSEEYAKKCKDKGDWCAKHDRAESQCFICHPEYKEKFAAKYRAKYGTEPPPMKSENVSAPAAPAAPAAIKITVPEMDCEACAEKLVKKVTAVPGVAKVEANVAAQTLTITPKEKESPSPKALWETCATAGYDPTKLEGPGGVFTSKPDK
jgi:copper chaperone CopZ